MGVWNPRTNTGTAQFSEYKDLPAKKIWSWGADADGMAWRKALSDNESAYVEVQAGLFRNQETYSFLDPGQTTRFTEYWMPVRRTGGISRANKAGVVKLDVQKAQLTARLNVNAPIAGRRHFAHAKRPGFMAGKSDLAPTTIWTRTIALQNSTSSVTFELRDREGHSLLRQTNDEYNLDPVTSIKIRPPGHLSDPWPGTAFGG